MLANKHSRVKSFLRIHAKKMTAQHYTCSVFYRGKYENGNENGYIATFKIHNKLHWYGNCINKFLIILF